MAWRIICLFRGCTQSCLFWWGKNPTMYAYSPFVCQLESPSIKKIESYLVEDGYWLHIYPWNFLFMRLTEDNVEIKPLCTRMCMYLMLVAWQYNSCCIVLVSITFPNWYCIGWFICHQNLCLDPKSLSLHFPLQEVRYLGLGSQFPSCFCHQEWYVYF